MLGRTAAGLYWMFRYLERSENTARLVEAGLRIALTNSTAAEDEWRSIIVTTGGSKAFDEKYDAYNLRNVVDFLLRDTSEPGSVMSMIEMARNNARMVRTALTREVWEVTNECWMTLRKTLATPIPEHRMPEVLQEIRQHSALVRGALHGTMMRNEIYNFCRIGTFIERAESTARILDVKYYVLLPTASHVGSTIDNFQWETILRAVSGTTAYRWAHGGDANARTIADFLIFDRRMPRSLAFCSRKIEDNLGYIEKANNNRAICYEQADAINAQISEQTIDVVFDRGLHQFIQGFIRENAKLGKQIEQDYRFNE